MVILWSAFVAGSKHPNDPQSFSHPISTENNLTRTRTLSQTFIEINIILPRPISVIGRGNFFSLECECIIEQCINFQQNPTIFLKQKQLADLKNGLPDANTTKSDKHNILLNSSCLFNAIITSGYNLHTQECDV